MAVYTQISKQQMQIILQQGYGLDIVQVKPIAAGIENSIYQVFDVSGQSYAFVIFESLDLSLVEAYCVELARLQTRLAASATVAHIFVPAGIPLLQSPTAQSPRYCLEILDNASKVMKPSVLQPWIAGEHRLPDTTASFQLGAFLGVLNAQQPHENSIPDTAFPKVFTSQIPVNQHFIRIGLVEQVLSEHSQAVQVQFQQLKSQCVDVMSAHDKLTYGLVHGDLFTDNALQDEQGVVGVIDFFNASWSPRLLDLAICLMDWCVRDGVFDKALTQALIQGFRQNCERVSDIELEQWPNLVRLAAFRFWCTRQEYYLACQKRGLEPVQNRSPSFCLQVFQQVSVQEQFLLNVWRADLD